MSLPLDRIPPQSLDMEQAVLGSMMILPEAIDRTREILRAADFYRDSHREVFSCIVALDERREPVNILTVQEELRARELFEQCGGLPALTGMLNAVVTPSNAGHYAKVVKDKAVRRRLIAAASDILSLAHSDAEDIEEIIAASDSALTQATATASTANALPMRTLVSQAFEQIEEWERNKRPVTGIPTGLDDLDYLLRGLQPETLYIIAARPGMGKSALAALLAMQAAKLGNGVFIASLEMSSLQITHRMIATRARVDGHAVRTGFITGEQWRKIGEASSQLSEVPILIADDAGMTLNQLRIHCRRMAREKLGLVIVDYMQLLDAEATSKDNRTREIDIIAKALKGIAKELDVPVVALAQLSREVDKRSDRRPVMGDLRESGGIEANADVVIFPYNPAHYGPEDERKDCEPVHLIVAKHRDGMTGTAKALWFRRFTEFANVATDHDPQGTLT